jgi:hypothetical protein
MAKEMERFEKTLGNVPGKDRTVMQSPRSHYTEFSSYPIK